MEWIGDFSVASEVSESRGKVREVLDLEFAKNEGRKRFSGKEIGQ